jgi:uncharacterized protein
MPRPRKCRRVCCMPGSTLYGPLNGPMMQSESIIMTVEEYETIRLIDQEGLTQEECAENMEVARATVQNIYKAARTKLATSLINGNVLKIEGGDFQLYDDSEKIHGCPRCRRRQNEEDEKPSK